MLVSRPSIDFQSRKASSGRPTNLNRSLTALHSTQDVGEEVCRLLKKWRGLRHSIDRPIRDCSMLVSRYLKRTPSGIHARTVMT